MTPRPAALWASVVIWREERWKVASAVDDSENAQLVFGRSIEDQVVPKTWNRPHTRSAQAGVLIIAHHPHTRDVRKLLKGCPYCTHKSI